MVSPTIFGMQEGAGSPSSGCELLDANDGAICEQVNFQGCRVARQTGHAEDFAGEHYQETGASVDLNTAYGDIETSRAADFGGVIT